MATKTYEIPTDKGVQIVESDSRANALASLKAGSTFTPNTPITSENLKSAPVINTTTPPTQSSAAGANAELTSLNQSDIVTQKEQDALTIQTAKETADREAKFNSTQKAIDDALKNRKGETELTDTAYSEKNVLGTTVDETSKKLKDISNKINAIDIRANEQIKQIEKNADGLSTRGVNGLISNIQRQAFSDKADLYIEKLSAQGDFDSAKAIADRKVAVQLEQDKQTLETLQFQYENNKDLFTKSEQRQFELAQTDRNNAYEAKKTELKTISDLSLDAMQNGAPPIIASQMRSAKTVEEAMQIGGQYVGLLDRQTKQANLAKIYKDLNASLNTSNTVDANQIGSNAPAVVNNNAALQTIFQSSKVSAGNKTSIGNGLALAKAASDLADANLEGKFTGLYPGRSIVDFFTPEAFKRAKTTSNESLISALDLQTQFWASGAALSAEQTKLVQKMIPTKSDKDSTIQAKTNQLVNYMLSQTASRLLTDGIDFVPAKVDLFNATPTELENMDNILNS